MKRGFKMEKRNSFMTQFSILAISLFLTSATSINGALPQMQNELGMNNFVTELVATLPALAVVIFVILSSFIAEKIGTKRTIQIGLILVGVGGAAPIILPNYQLILVSRFILGAGFGLFNSLAVSIINMLYRDEHKKRADLLGFRGSSENIGNTLMTLLAGVFLAFGWRLSFGVYLLAFPILILFTIFVPEIKEEETNSENQVSTEVGKLEMPVYVLALFALFLVMTFIAFGVRFPAMATSLKGPNFNASTYLAMHPLIGIIAGAIFGPLNRILKEKCLYLGMGLLIVSCFMVSNAQDSFPMLVIGYLISGIPGALILPFIYNALNDYASKDKMNAATSIIVIGCNVGNFIAPFSLQFFQFLSGSSSIFAPFTAIGITLLIIIIILMIGSRRSANSVAKR